MIAAWVVALKLQPALELALGDGFKPVSRHG
jgi:hypothetical protein